MLRWLVGACIALELLYVVAVNAFLNLGGIALLFESTNQVNATFRRGYSVWPGSVHLRDLRIVFQDANVQFSIDLPRVHTNIELLELASRRFHATRVSGEGLVFRMRHRIQPETAGEPSVRAFAPIREFSDPPLFEATAPLPPIPEDQYDLWTVHLEGVDVNVREVWAQYVRYVGSGRARGAFRLRPARTLWVGPASLELEPGRLTLGEKQELARALHGEIRTTVHFFDVQKPVGMQVFRYVSTELKLRGDGFRAEPLAMFVPAASGVTFDAAPGVLRLDAEVDHGRFSEASALVLELPEVRTRAEGFAVTVRGVELSAHGAPGGRGEARAVVTTAELERPGASRLPLRAERVVVSATSSSRDAAAEWAFVEARGSVGQAGLDDASALHGLFDLPGVTLEGGALSASGEARLAEGTIRGQATTRATKLRFRKDAVSGTFDGELGVRVDRLKPSERAGDVAAQFRGTRLELRGRGARAVAAALDIHARAAASATRAEVDVSAELRGIGLNAGAELQAPRVTLRGRFVEDERGARSTVASARVPEIVGRRDGVVLKAALELGGQLLEGARAGDPSRVHADLALRDVELRSEQAGGEDVLARSERLDVRSKLWRDARGRWSGSVASEAKALWARVGGTWVRADPRFTAELERFDVERVAGHVRAELAVRNFVADDRSDGLECPWSTVPKGSVTADLELDPEQGSRGSVEADVENARLVWGDFSATGDARLEAKLEKVFAAEGRGRVDFRLAASDIALRSGQTDTTGWSARVPALIVSGDLTRKDAVLGSLRVRAERGTGRIGRTRLETDLAADFRVLALELDQQRGRIAGTVRLDRARVTAGEESVSGWWAKVDVDSAALSARENLDVSALFRARLRDALPGIAVLSASGELPGWFGSALPLRELDVVGLVHRRCKLTDIRFTRVSGGPLTSRGRLQSVPDAVRGAFLVRLSDFEAISAGLSFDERESGVSWLVSDGWYGEREAGLDAQATTALEGPCVPAPRTCGP